MAAALGDDVPHQTLLGSTARRASCVRRFNDHEIQAILVCVEHSAAGLHLACARHVVLLHPFVGDVGAAAALEEQAIGRALRLGQTRDVTVHHLMAPGTAEESYWRMRHPTLDAVFNSARLD